MNGIVAQRRLGNADSPEPTLFVLKAINEPLHDISNNVVRVCDQQSHRSTCAYAKSDQSLCYSLEYSMSIKLLIDYHVEFLSLKRGCTGSSEAILVKIPHCWKSHIAAQM